MRGRRILQGRAEVGWLQPNAECICAGEKEGRRSWGKEGEEENEEGGDARVGVEDV